MERGWHVQCDEHVVGLYCGAHEEAGERYHGETESAG